MERRKKALICLFLLVSLIFPRVKIVKAEALPNEVLEGSATVADIVMTYYAESGAAVSNTDFINTLYNDLGTNFGTIEDLAEQGLLVLNETTGKWESTASLATAIENTSAYASLHLNEVFNVSAEEAAEIGGGVAAATGGTILGTAAAGVATIGTVPLLGAVTAAYWAGIGIGTLISHLFGLYGDSVYNGAPITYTDFLSNLPAGSTGGIFGVISPSLYAYKQGVYIQGRIFALAYQSNGYISGWYYCLDRSMSSGTRRYNIVNMADGSSAGAGTTTFSNGVSGSFSPFSLNSNYTYILTPLAGTFNDANALNSYIQALKNGTEQLKIYSPDLIGPNGNLYADDSEGNITVPDMLPQIDTSVEAGKPLRLQDWLNFANQANTNTGGGQPDLNKDLFDDILDRIKTLIPSTPDPSPDPTPDPGGQTRPVPTPTPVPDPDYDVPQPEQPEWQSETTQQTEEVPDSIPTGKPWVVEGLQNKFPFCIPWDIKNMLGKFSSASRQAPYISWRFNPPFTPIDYTFQVDLADFEDAAAILRTLELIAFIVGLAFATRYLIGAT